jgi:hypothetical protein
MSTVAECTSHVCAPVGECRPYSLRRFFVQNRDAHPALPKATAVGTVFIASAVEKKNQELLHRPMEWLSNGPYTPTADAMKTVPMAVLSLMSYPILAC